MIERSFRIEESAYEQLKEIGDAENLPVSYLVRIAIARLIDWYDGSVSFIEIEKQP